MAHVLLVFGSVNIVYLEWLQYGTAQISEQFYLYTQGTILCRKLVRHTLVCAIFQRSRHSAAFICSVGEFGGSPAIPGNFMSLEGAHAKLKRRLPGPGSLSLTFSDFLQLRTRRKKPGG